MESIDTQFVPVKAEEEQDILVKSSEKTPYEAPTVASIGRWSPTIIGFSIPGGA